MTAQQRVIIEGIKPEIDGGRFAVKAIIGDTIEVEADVFLDGHDKLSAYLLYKSASAKTWSEVPMSHLGNDSFRASFVADTQGFYQYTIEAWVDHPASWQHEIGLKIRDWQHVNVELLMGANYLDQMAKLAKADDKKAMVATAKTFRDSAKYEEAIAQAQSIEMSQWIARYPLRHHATRHPERKLWVDRAKAGFSTWYSLFPRSTHPEGKHGTFKTTESILPRLARMGFDVLYIPPIHPIGMKFRKGKNNSTTCQPGEPGVPYGIGSELGGHDAIHPELGTLKDLQSLMKACQQHGIELAMDLAIQCSPDHPWAKDHQDWFKVRPDGSIQYAENPPKKYQDIYPVNFETEDWQNLWNELLRTVMLWAEWGIRIIRVDNPHTKSFGFWEWLIEKVQAKYPDMIFLAEAFTKPKVMAQLAKLGYGHSYTYYTWRNTKAEIIEYMTELTQTEMRHYFRPNFWPNTHDILPYCLQSGLEPVFLTRLFMAATLSANYGVFGPIYEFMHHEANPGKEEYKNSEKYEIGHWDWSMENKVTQLMTLVNRSRKENSALQNTNNITFCEVHNEQLLAYLKTHPNGNKILSVVNIDPYNRQGAAIRVPLSLIGKAPDQEYVVHDLLTSAKYIWKGEWNFVELDPQLLPMHLFRIEDF
jgi:starch synthase (maltosyl-transferring)